MRAHRILVGAALVLGFGAAVVGTPYPRDRGQLSVRDLVADIEAGIDRIDPVSLADRLRARDDALRIVDLRTAAAFESFTLPQAEQVPLGALLDASLDPAGTVVLISDDGSLAAQGWALLRSTGEENVVVLDGGVIGWIRTILTPSIPVDPPDHERAYWEKRIELAEYFGGSPRLVSGSDPDIVRTGDAHREAAARVDRLVHEGRELGCGW